MKLSLKRGALTFLREILRRGLGNPSFESMDEKEEEEVLVKEASLAACIVTLLSVILSQPQMVDYSFIFSRMVTKECWAVSGDLSP